MKDIFPEESKEEEKEEKERKKIIIPKLKLEIISPINIRRYSQPLKQLSSRASISPKSKKKLHKDYLDTIICESKKLMTIIDEAKKKIYDKPISIFEKAKNNFENYKRIKSARENLHSLKSKKKKFGSVMYLDSEIKNLSPQNNQRNSILFFPSSNTEKLKTSNSVNLINNSNNNFSNKYVHNIQNKNIIQSESTTQTEFKKKNIDRLNIKFSKSHNKKLINNYSDLKDNHKVVFKIKNFKNNNTYILNNSKKNLKINKFRINFEKEDEKRKKTHKFINKILKLKKLILTYSTEQINNENNKDNL